MSSQKPALTIAALGVLVAILAWQFPKSPEPGKTTTPSPPVASSTSIPPSDASSEPGTTNAPRTAGSLTRVSATDVGPRAAGMVVDAQRQRVHVAAEGRLITLDSWTGAPVGASVNIDDNATGVALNEQTGDVFVLAGKSNMLYAVDPIARRVTRSVQAGGGAGGSIVNPELDEIYVSNNAGNVIEIFRASTLERLAAVDCGPSPRGLAIDFTKGVLYVANATTAGTVTPMDARTRTVGHSIRVGRVPLGLAHDPTTQRLYVTNSESNSMSVIDEGQERVADTVDVGRSPLGIALDGNGRVYVGNKDDDSVTVIDGSSAITTITDAGDGPQQVRFDEITKRLFVSSWGSGQVRIWQLS